MKPAGLHIRAGSLDDADLISGTIAASFEDVARRFDLTRANCPTHPSFYTRQKAADDLGRGLCYYIAELDGRPAGCAAIEQPNDTTCYLERLAVQPFERRRGIGQTLVEKVLAEATARRAGEVGIAIIAAHADLRRWYEKIGFVVTETKRFPHLPFSVTFLNYRLVRKRPAL